jgi:hypothetical protein
MKTFRIENNIKNLKWVNKNLDPKDFYVYGNEIVITYYNDMQRNDIIFQLIENSHS